MKKILVMGGGEFHDYTGCCEVMARQLKELPEYEVEVSINDLDKLKRGVIDRYDIIVFYWTKDHLTEEQKAHVLQLLQNEDKNSIKHDLALMPDWVQTIVMEVL